MLTKTLRRIDNSINSPNLTEQILKAKRGYYVYFNEPNKKLKTIKIHRHICGQCAWGSGKIRIKEPGKNGVWLGPFTSASQASNFIKDYFPVYYSQLQTCPSCIK